jgi:3',5'-cyclic AMP phosphodiesterase CpdA
MTTLAHISDLHFGREDSRLITGLQQSLAEIQPQLVVISGDLTQRARTQEFIAARDFVDNLQWPFLVIPGNHDIPAYNLAERFFSPWRKWHRYFGYPLEPAMSTEDFVSLGLNTSRRISSLLDWSRGRINTEQITEIAKYMGKATEEKLRIVVIHHPFWLPEKYLHRHTISGQKKALQVMKEVGVDIILGGHVHYSFSHIVDGIIISQAGTTLSNRLMENSRNSFKVIRGNRRSLTIETREWQHNTFRLADCRLFKRIQDRWTDSI